MIEINLASSLLVSGLSANDMLERDLALIANSSDSFEGCHKMLRVRKSGKISSRAI